jgi:hypothetical protein
MASTDRKLALKARHRGSDRLTDDCVGERVNLLKPTGYAMYQQFNIKQLYIQPTLYLCALHLSQNKQRLLTLRA